MKPLLDQNPSRRLLPELASLFPGSSPAQPERLASAGDRALRRFAGEHGFAIVAKNADLLALQLIQGFPPRNRAAGLRQRTEFGSGARIDGTCGNDFLHAGRDRRKRSGN
ncbi:MAG: DUF5615 family PIN-like protein [Azoarcus sp.]|nr:DUF5615 family PIN-like protein [Azoarcus sp.]